MIARAVLLLVITSFVPSPTWGRNNGSNDQQHPVVKNPRCQDKCGDLTVPYPFGIADPDCSLSPEFNLSCKSQKLYLQDDYKVTNLSSDGELSIETWISYYCIYRAKDKIETYQGNRISLLENSSFAFSTTRNAFTVLGCDTLGIFEPTEGNDYTGGCLTYCTEYSKPMNGSCNGVGCCQVPLQQGLRRIWFQLESRNNYSNVGGDTACGYAFIVDKEKFNFSVADLVADDFWYRLYRAPFVLDWAVGGVNASLDMEKTNKICVGGEYTEAPAGVNGYRCKCLDGYEGNPYLANGCYDINECERGTANCSSAETCINTEGSFECVTNRPMRITEIVIAAGASALFLFVGIVQLYWSYERGKRISGPKGKNYSRNGGFKLQDIAYSDPDVRKLKFFTEHEVDTARAHFKPSRQNTTTKNLHDGVSKGRLPDDRIVAIKEIETTNIKKNRQVDKFVEDIVVIYKAGGASMLQLLGCCFDTKLPLLVYEFNPNMINGAPSLSNPIIVAAETMKMFDKFSDLVVSLTVLMQEIFGYCESCFQVANEENDVLCFGLALAIMLSDGNHERLNKPLLGKSEADVSKHSIKLLDEISKGSTSTGTLGDDDCRLSKLLELARRCSAENSSSRPKMRDIVDELHMLTAEWYAGGMRQSPHIAETRPLLADNKSTLDNVV